MYSLFHMPSATFLTGFVLLLQAPFNQASGAHPSESAQKTQTLILPFYLKPEPLSEKKLVFRRSLSSFPFYEKNPRIHHFVREYPGLTFDEGVSLFVQRNALGQTPGDVCARLHELTALMQHRNMKSRQWSSCLTGFLENAFLRTYSFRYAPIDLEALSLCALIELEMEDGCPSSLRTRILKISGNRGYLYGKREHPAKKTGFTVVYKNSSAWKRRPLPDGSLWIPPCQSLHTPEGTSKSPMGGVIHTAYTRHGRRPFFNSKVDYSPFQEKKA